MKQLPAKSGGAIMTESRFDIGLHVRKEVLGSEYVEQALARTTEFDADFQRFITEMAWGSVWARPDLDRRTRSLVTIAILAALGREELAVHLRASRNIGVDPHEIAEVLLHVAVYAGVPAANTAFAMAKKELARQADVSEEVDPAKTSQEDI
jgi:4-carboxymuconolactone decarboxylase